MLNTQAHNRGWMVIGVLVDDVDLPMWRFDRFPLPAGAFHPSLTRHEHADEDGRARIHRHPWVLVPEPIRRSVRIRLLNQNLHAARVELGLHGRSSVGDRSSYTVTGFARPQSTIVLTMEVDEPMWGYLEVDAEASVARQGLSAYI